MSGFGFWPCAPGCEASASDPRYCDCRCRGVNHGRLLVSRPAQPFYSSPAGHVIDVSPLPDTGYVPVSQIAQQLALPLPPVHKTAESSDRLSPSSNRPAGIPVTSRKTRLARTIAKHAFGHVSQNELNESVLKGLRIQLSEENTEAAILQAYTIFHERVGSDSNRPELYELYENGDIDKALEYFGKSWVIGRPKKRARN